MDSILEDILLSVRLPVFTKRAKRRIVTHPKFYFFDAGVWFTEGAGTGDLVTAKTLLDELSCQTKT